MNGFDQTLAQLGVGETTLSAAEGESLDQNGYVVLDGILDPVHLAHVRTAFEAAMGPGRAAGSGRQSGTRHVDGLPWTDAAFDVVYTHARVLSAVAHVLRRAFRVFQASGRDPLPGFGQQGLHTDWMPRAPSEPFRVVTVLWLLDDFTPENGATRLVPASHRLPRPLPKSMQAPGNHHPEERLVIAPAGASLVFNGHLWHSGTRNRSQGPRRVIQCQFVARDSVPPADPLDPPQRLSPAARAILGA